MELQLVIVSLIAGILTILAPCVFPLLPLLLGASAENNKGSRNRAVTIVVSLLASIIILTLLIYGTSNVLNINGGYLRIFSVLIIILISITMLFPDLWEKFVGKIGFNNSSNKLLSKAMQNDGKYRDILIGVSLGPVFSSCSPTYGLIIATILPQNFIQGFVYLLWYVLGLGIMFMLVAVLGRKFTTKLSWAVDPNGWFKKTIGVVFLIIGLAVLFNFDKSFETWLLNLDFYDNLVNFELNLQ